MKRKYFVISTFLITIVGFSQNNSDVKSYTDLSHKQEIELRNKIINDFNLSTKNSIVKATELNLPLSFKDENGNTNILFSFEGENPIYKVVDNFGSARTARVNLINSGGSMGLNLNGQGMNIGVWDGGPIRTTHNSLLGRVVIGDAQTFMTSDDDTVHAIHVAGTIAASDQNVLTKGLAYQSTIHGHTFSNDVPEVLTFAMSGGLVSNHSYGTRIEYVNESLRGAYSSESQTWDNITNLYPYYLPVISAGNDRGKTVDNTQGVDLLLGNKNSKNVVVVAAVNQVLSYQNANSVVMSSFSSWGPTDDFRIKPDISAKGVAVTSLSSSDDNATTTLQGTSMAAPAVTATLALLQQHYNNLNSSWMRSSMLKAVMINSADEAGSAPGPDFKFGWGLINGASGVSVISNKNTSSIMEDVTLNNNEVYQRQIESNGQKLKVTIVWNDPSATPNSPATLNDRTSKLVNDLDMRLEKDGEIYYPWILDVNNIQSSALKQDNYLDNVEQIEIDVPSGVYDLKVTHKNNLKDQAPQIFSLVASNATFVNLSSEDFTLTSFKIFPNPSTGLVNIQSNFSFTSDITVFDVQGRKVYTDLNKVIDNNSVLDLSFLSKGVYTIRVTSDNSTKNELLIIK